MLLRRVVRGVAAEIDIDVLYEQFTDLMQLYAPSNCVNGGSPWRDLPAPSAAPTAPTRPFIGLQSASPPFVFPPPRRQHRIRPYALLNPACQSGELLIDSCAAGR
jgi:hypothetical protein